MKLFKNIDKRFEEIGFKKIKDNQHCVYYERFNDKYNYTQVLGILHKESGNHIVQSYDKELFDSEHIGNTCVGLNYYEIRLILKKMKQKGWK